MVGPRVRKRNPCFSALLSVIWAAAFFWVRGLGVHDFWVTIFYFGFALALQNVVADALRLPERPTWLRVVRTASFAVALMSAWPQPDRGVTDLRVAAFAALLYVVLVGWQLKLYCNGAPS